MRFLSDENTLYALSLALVCNRWCRNALFCNNGAAEGGQLGFVTNN